MEHDEESVAMTSEINSIASTTQQKELSQLATLLQSEKDREKYIKVIEMSKEIQSKLDALQDGHKSVNTYYHRNPMMKKNSCWSLNHPEFYHGDSTRSSSRSSNTTDSSLVTSPSDCGNEPLVTNGSSRYHTFNGHSYRAIDRMTSLQFQTDSTYIRRPSADTILLNVCSKEQEKHLVFVTPNRKQTARKPIAFEEVVSSDDDDEVVVSDIHIAVRRDASLFKIEKLSTTTCSDTNEDSPITSIKSKEMQHSLDDNRQLLKEKKENQPGVNAGLLTPPHSPQFDYNTTDTRSEPLILFPHIIHVQKKTYQSIKGLLKRSYQLNQYTVTKANSITLGNTSHGGLLYKTFDSCNGKAVFLIKLIIASLDSNSCQSQKRYGFSFWWQTQHTVFQNYDDDAKFALAPDSLVKEALITWIESQNEQSKGVLPFLSKSDEILRDGRKLYIVYSASLFP